ncbi:hypothetical protein [Amycolatopsis plumensis]|uniref:hypothetical protein n=1 Tax=Amycolatopsis plumensis TaxID=236508 RepID=UPI00361765C8
MRRVADDWSAPHPAPAPIGALGAGFVTGPPTPKRQSRRAPAPGRRPAVAALTVAVIVAGLVRRRRRVPESSSSA